MGQIPNKTYTAPDGSVYRVEADGSVTKIKGGRVESNEPPSKYQITPDGKIYRVEADGSVTYLGNAEDCQYSPHIGKSPVNKRSDNKWVWPIVIFLVFVAVVGVFVYKQIADSASGQDWTKQDDTLAVAQEEAVGLIEPQNAMSSNEVSTDSVMLSKEDKELDHIFYPGDIQGEFYGSIDELGTIHGSWSCGSQMGGGWYYFESQGEDSGRDLDYTIDSPLIWYERIDHGTEYVDTGVWYFDYFDGTKDCIATGTYVRSADNRKFKFRLYKQ